MYPIPTANAAPVAASDPADATRLPAATRCSISQSLHDARCENTLSR